MTVVVSRHLLSPVLCFSDCFHQAFVSSHKLHPILYSQVLASMLMTHLLGAFQAMKLMTVPR